MVHNWSESVAGMILRPQIQGSKKCIFSGVLYSIFFITTYLLTQTSTMMEVT